MLNVMVWGLNYSGFCRILNVTEIPKHDEKLIIGCSVSCQHGDHSLLWIDGTGGSLGVIRVMMLEQCGGGVKNHNVQGHSVRMYVRPISQ